MLLANHQIPIKDKGPEQTEHGHLGMGTHTITERCLYGLRGYIC